MLILKFDHHSSFCDLGDITDINMKLVIISALVSLAIADSLDNTYLPPSNSRSVGGNRHFQNAPFRGRSSLASQFGRRQQVSRQYGAPSTQFGQTGFRRPSAEYGVPSSSFGQGGNNFAQRPSSSYGVPSGNGYSGIGGRFNGRAQSREAGAAILRYNNENFGDGTYRFEYETENGISQQEQGELNAGAQAVRGSYTYTGDDDQTYTVNYIADENGFQPFGEHIAQISQAVQTSLQRNAAEAQQGYNYNGNGGYNGAANKQYLPPNNAGVNQRSGYQY